MISNFLYLCPSCGKEDGLYEKSRYIFCKFCLQQFPKIDNQIGFKEKKYTYSQFYGLIREHLQLFGKSDHRCSGKAILYQGKENIKFRGFAGLDSTIECPVELDRGTVCLTADSFIFKGENEECVFPKNMIRCFTTNSRKFEFKVHKQPFYQLKFLNESPLKYQDLFKKWFNESYIEHQPLLRNSIPTPPAEINITKPKTVSKNNFEKMGFREFFLHLLVGLPLKYFVKFTGGLEIHNVHLIPQNGPFILIANHQSFIDPMLLSVVLPRKIGFLTKSTSFCSAILRQVFYAYRAIPTRRYEINPVLVNHVRRYLEKGIPVGIFPEGERCWDGELLPFKLGTVKLLMAFNVPIVCARFTGAYHFMPRWTHRPNRNKIRIEILPPISLKGKKNSVQEAKEYLQSFFS